MIAFRHARRVTLILGLAGFAPAACGATDGDLFGTGAPVDTDAGEGGEPDDGSGGLAAGGRNTGGVPPSGGSQTGGVATGGEPMRPMPTGGVGGGSGGAQPCEFAGDVYEPGESFKDDCNTCVCVSGDLVQCTLIACPEPQGGAGGAAGGRTCTDIVRDVNEELDLIQSCDSDDECGQVLEGTSCGCTRDLVARKDADVSRFQALNGERNQLCEGLASTCDCPAADGFKCSSNRCGWNYQNTGSCTATPPGQLCLKRDEGALGATVEVGEKLAIQVQPRGCFSSSCTATRISTCSIQAEGPDFVATAEFCMVDTSVQGGGCTADCSGGFAAECQSEVVLTKGEHTVTLGDMSLTFTVPGAIPEDAVCVGNRF